MDERCQSALADFASGIRAPWMRCEDCAHVLALHGSDGMCDACSVLRQVNRQK